LERERDARQKAELASAALQAAERERARSTAELAAERTKLYAVVMRTPVSVAVFEGPEARYTLVNDAYRRFLDGRPLEGRPLRDVFPELADHPLIESVYEVYRTGEPITLEERVVELPVPGGGTRTRCFTASFLPIHDDRGRTTGVITAGTDITDQVRARAALEASLRFAEQFVGILGHDLRNPLQSIIAAASVLHARGAGEPERRMIARIQASAERMANMVAQLLDLTRLRLGGGIVLDPRLVSLHAIVADVVDELHQVHPSRRIACALGPEVRGEWDAERLSQVVSNLVGNAIQYGDPAHPIDVTITTHGDEVALAVHSVGPPIPRALLPAIFEPYHRGERPSGTSQGLGLGLYIAHQIVLGHGGHLDLDSTEDGHTTFTVVLHRSRDRSLPGSP
ncbi:MAG TPA: PAS domain-containing sensor histidine kinase, partial [Kofleriaceae bacterium]